MINHPIQTFIFSIFQEITRNRIVAFFHKVLKWYFHYLLIKESVN